MTEDGEWVLNEPYASEVMRLKLAATVAFNNTLYEELSKISPYTAEQLEGEYVRRCVDRSEPAGTNVTSFIVEAMSGQLYQ